jgi:hypothetical protein
MDSQNNVNLSHRNAIIFIPGLFSQEQKYYLNIFSEGLENQSVFYFKNTGEITIPGYSGERLALYSIDNSLEAYIDIYEGFWLDIIAEEKLSDKDLKTKLLGGTDLLFYWLFSKIWQAFFEVPSLIIGLTSTLLSLVLWYYGILLTIIKEIVTNKGLFGQILPESLVKVFENTSYIFDKWLFFIMIGLIIYLSTSSFNKIVDASFFAKRYLSNVGGINLRNKINSRIRKITDDILNNYDNVTIIGHSFGGVIGTVFLADYQSKIPVKYITLGSTNKLLSYRSKIIFEAVQKCIENPIISEWQDYYSYQDWLGSDAIIIKHPTEKLKSHEFFIECTFTDRLFGKSHMAFLSNPTWIKNLNFSKITN